MVKPSRRLGGLRGYGLAVALVTLLQAQDCPGGAAKYVAAHYDLPQCPGDSLVLSDSAREGPYRIAAVRRTVYHCPRFRGYVFSENGRERLQLMIGLRHGQACGVDVLYSFAPSQDRRTHLKENGARWALTAARLASGSSNLMPPGFSASTVDTFDTYAHLLEWCTRGSDRSNGPCAPGRSVATRQSDAPSSLAGR